MAKIPLKYCEQIKEALRYVDEYKLRNVKVYIDWTELSNERYYDICHYDTLIARLYPSSNVVCLFGGYSASDRDIINSFIELYGLSGKVHKKGDSLYYNIDE